MRNWKKFGQIGQRYLDWNLNELNAGISLLKENYLISEEKITGWKERIRWFSDFGGDITYLKIYIKF